MELPKSNSLPIENLSACFKDTTNAYKFYWFLSILDYIAEKKMQQIPIKEIAIRMISSAWYPLDYYKLSFGKQDGFKKIAQELSKKISIDNSLNSPSLFDQIKTKLDKNDIDLIYRSSYKLLRWVPYRFIRPFFKNQLHKVPDSQVNKKIIKLANHYNNKHTPYFFKGESIIITRDWYDYFTNNQVILRGFIKWHLVNFLQKHNPNIIGLPNKLEKPIQRDLKLARKYWEEYISNNEIKCIFSNSKIKTGLFSLDHFLPWSFVAHDQLWNIAPIIKSVNSMKKDSVPSIEKYLDPFLMQHFSAISYHLKIQNFNYLDDYLSILDIDLDGLKIIDFLSFKNKMNKIIVSYTETAKSLGFNYPFVYK